MSWLFAWEKFTEMFLSVILYQAFSNTSMSYAGQELTECFLSSNNAGIIN
jgi:hypothetical protein